MWLDADVAGGAELAAAAPGAPAPMGTDPAAPPLLVRRVEIVGSSLPAVRLERLRARYTGRPLDAPTGAAAVRALERLYRAADVALSGVGGAGLGADGVLTLAVLEGRIEGVDVEGGPPRLRRTALAYAQRLVRERPLTRTGYQRTLALLALLPGVEARTALAVTAAPGVMRLHVVLHAARVRADVKLDDRGARAFGRWQGRVDARAYSVLTGGDQAVLTLGATPDLHRLRLLGATYTRPIGDRGLTAAVAAVHVQAQPYAADPSSAGASALFALAYPFVLRADRTLTGSVIVDGQDGRTAAGGVVFADERTRNLRAALTGVRLFGTTTATGGVTVTAGLPGLGAHAARAGYAPRGYGKVNLYGALSTPYGPWTVRLRAAAQATGSRLPSSEQLVLGGEDYGRAFRAADVQGDDGYGAAAELALRLHPTPLGAAELFAYADGGRVNLRRRPDEPDGDREGRLLSAGAGVRLAVGPATGLELSADRALDGRDPFGRRERGWRLGVRLHLAYTS